jgi:hypothetical protein
LYVQDIVGDGGRFSDAKLLALRNQSIWNKKQDGRRFINFFSY